MALSLATTSLGGFAPPSVQPDLARYTRYVREYNKHYTDAEFWSHYKVFNENVEYIESANKNRSIGYYLGINAFTDIPRRDFARTYLSNFMEPHGPLPPHAKQGIPGGLADAVDWRASGWVTDVKDQGQCGSCWAFSAVGAIEGQHANVTKSLVSFSEQNLVDCSYGEGCDGGWPEAAMRYVAENRGLDTEDAYPYTATDNSCAYAKNSSGGTVNGTENITAGSMAALYEAIAKVGPISVAIDAEGDFQFYESGIFTSTSCSAEYLDHAVLAVGYGVSAGKHKYIIVKNSWGKDWGMGGYIYMSADLPNMCGIASCASYPIVAPEIKDFPVKPVAVRFP
jgi:hypothetical protein